MKEKKLTIKEAAERMGINQQQLRIAIQQGNCPFGFAKRTENNIFTYFLSRAIFDQWYPPKEGE